MRSRKTFDALGRFVFVVERRRFFMASSSAVRTNGCDEQMFGAE
jgi:hypothetical protein